MYRCRSATVSPQTVATKDFQQNVGNSANYESWVVPAGVPSALADIGGGVEANY